MPQRLKRKCNRLGCNELTVKSYCQKHQKPFHSAQDHHKRNTRTPSGKKVYDTRWRKFRDAFLSKPENALCRECKKSGFVVSASEVDHILPIHSAPELKFEPKNCQPLCKSCHSRKTAYEVNRRIYRSRKKKRKPLVVVDPD